MSFCPVTESINSYLKEQDDYDSWVESMEATIIEHYGDSEPEAPAKIYEGVTDDDYPKVYNTWLSNLTIDDVPDDFISKMYDDYEGGPGYDEDVDRDR